MFIVRFIGLFVILMGMFILISSNKRFWNVNLVRLMIWVSYGHVHQTFLYNIQRVRRLSCSINNTVLIYLLKFDYTDKFI